MDKEALITVITITLIISCGLLASVWLAGVINAYYEAWLGR